MTINKREDLTHAPERDRLCGEHPGVWLVNVTGKGWVCPTVLTPAEKSAIKQAGQVHR